MTPWILKSVSKTNVAHRHFTNRLSLIEVWELSLCRWCIKHRLLFEWTFLWFRLRSSQNLRLWLSSCFKAWLLGKTILNIWGLCCIITHVTDCVFFVDWLFGCLWLFCWLSLRLLCFCKKNFFSGFQGFLDSLWKIVIIILYRSENNLFPGHCDQVWWRLVGEIDRPLFSLHDVLAAHWAENRAGAQTLVAACAQVLVVR